MKKNLIILVGLAMVVAACGRTNQTPETQASHNLEQAKVEKTKALEKATTDLEKAQAELQSVLDKTKAEKLKNLEEAEKTLQKARAEAQPFLPAPVAPVKPAQPAQPAQQYPPAGHPRGGPR